MTYKECFLKGKAALEQAGIEEAALDARLLLEAVCGTDRNELLVHGERPVEADREAQYAVWIAKRAEHIPLQHLTGVQDFMGLEFKVNEHVLIPRQDTEILVEEAMRQLQDGSRILDMCTGSGCILISLLHYSNNCSGLGVDISEEALAVARQNAKLLSCFSETTVSAPEGKIEFIQSNLFEKVTGSFEMIVSNPPYIRSEVVDTLMPEVREHEPRIALDGSLDGLFFYREIISGSREHLSGGGMLYLEIGYDQAAEVSSLMEQNGFKEIHVVKDYAGLDRVVFGTI